MMPAVIYRPLPQVGGPQPPEALPLAGGPLWFDRIAVHAPGEPARLAPAGELPPDIRTTLTATRPPICGLSLDRPRLMGVLNVTPDSFSDGGRYRGAEAAMAGAEAMVAEGADILDIGGESTRPGAETVSVAEEIDRVIRVISGLRARGVRTPISIDTRKAAVARAAFEAGADLLNDVSALTFDPDMPALAAASNHPVCLMHAQGDPKTMQDAPTYGDVLAEVTAFLEARVAVAEAAGIPRAHLVVDPGIGFGKTVAHNVALIRGLAALHGLGCPILFGASRKRFIGTLGAAPEPADRLAGSLAVALEALRQGAQVVRVHDVKETRQATALWAALNRVRDEE